jgi:hypothetical protein
VDKVTKENTYKQKGLHKDKNFSILLSLKYFRMYGEVGSSYKKY